MCTQQSFFNGACFLWGQVPNVFINGKHLGGNDDLMAARNSGKLKTLLQGAGVTFGEEL